MQILFIDACVRGAEQSRTHQLATAYLQAFCAKHPTATCTHLALSNMEISPLNATLLAERDTLSQVQDWSHPSFDLARQFASADHIVIAAPYWDFNFPAVLKIYLERITVCGITFRYDDHGVPQGLCKAQSMQYITTRGGYASGEFAFLDHASGYLQTLCQMYGIAKFDTLAAEGLDVWGNDPAALLDAAKGSV